MDVCEECFESDSIEKYIKENGDNLNIPMKCNSCENISEYRISEGLLNNRVQSIINEHFVHENTHGLIGSAMMMAKDEDDDIDDFLTIKRYSLKDICWELFDLDTTEENERFYELLRDYETDGFSEFDDNPCDELWLNIGCDWDGSNRVILDWSVFCKNVKHSARFFDHDGYNRTNALSRLKSTFKTLSIVISNKLYRARKVNTEQEYLSILKNPSIELGIAPVKLAKHNRFSPIGISYVYLSSDDETILKEIKCNVGDRIAVGTFDISELSLVDLRKNNLQSIAKNTFHEQCTAELLCSFKTIRSFIKDISNEVIDDGLKLDYIPTQLVSEYIWSLDYDGFIFDSSHCCGDNYVLFTDSYTYNSFEIKIT